MSKLKPCPQCHSDEELSISSNSSVRLSEVSCTCGYTFQNGAYEENIYKYWNNLPQLKDEG